MENQNRGDSGPESGNRKIDHWSGQSTSECVKSPSASYPPNEYYYIISYCHIRNTEITPTSRQGRNIGRQRQSLTKTPEVVRTCIRTFHGHVSTIRDMYHRWENQRLSYLAMHTQVEGDRSRGRQRTWWRDNIIKDNEERGASMQEGLQDGKGQRQVEGICSALAA